MKNTRINLTGTQTRIAVGVAWLALVGYCVWPSPPDPQKEAQRARESLLLDARVSCQQAVRSRLKAPSTAKFALPPYGEPWAEQLGQTTYRATGTYDAQNSFGAMLRGSYACDMRQRPDSSWTVVSLTVQ